MDFHTKNNKNHHQGYQDLTVKQMLKPQRQTKQVFSHHWKTGGEGVSQICYIYLPTFELPVLRKNSSQRNSRKHWKGEKHRDVYYLFHHISVV